MQNYTPINHAEIFSSVESILDFLSPTEAEQKDDTGKPLGLCKSYGLPLWHPFSNRGLGIITGAKLENEKIHLILTFSVNPQIPMAEAISRKWTVNELLVQSPEEIANFFVNGTIFGTDDGQFVIENGPNEFTWTYRAPICPECQKKEENADS